MNKLVELLIVGLIIVNDIGTPLLLVMGWMRWSREPKVKSITSVLSLVEFRSGDYFGSAGFRFDGLCAGASVWVLRPSAAANLPVGLSTFSKRVLFGLGWCFEEEQLAMVRSGLRIWNACILGVCGCGRISVPQRLKPVLRWSVAARVNPCP
jgi:hypothetical protein